MSDPVGFAGGSGTPKKKVKRKPKVTAKQAKFISGVIEGKSQYKAAKEANFTEAMSRNPALIMTPVVKEAMRFELEKLGITDEQLARKIADGLEAMRVQVATYEGSISDERAYVDFEQRGKYLDRALELKGHLKREPKTEINNPTFNVIIRDVGGPAGPTGSGDMAPAKTTTIIQSS